jgi:hypothetical protein
MGCVVEAEGERMYLLLLVFGALLTVAGLVLAASGVSIHDRAFDMSIATPGIVAVVGGLALIGLGVALRILQRIERALAQPMPRTARAGETGEFTPAIERPGEAARMPLPPKAAPRAHIAAVAVPVAERRPQDLPGKALGKLPEKAPAVARLESTTIIEEMDLALSARPSSSVDEAVGQFDRSRASSRKNGGAAAGIAPRSDTMPRLDLGARSPMSPERPKGPAFGTLWPQTPRPMRATQSAAAPAAVAAMPDLEPEQTNEPAQEAAQAVVAEQAQEVSVLKSGMVDGMAYTLFSDGSIEAELPQGTLRFGSIAELRDHIEQSA